MPKALRAVLWRSPPGPPEKITRFRTLPSTTLATLGSTHLGQRKTRLLKQASPPPFLMSVAPVVEDGKLGAFRLSNRA